MSIPFAKGHGTGNDFIIVPDDDARLVLTSAQVRALTHRRTGIGADGVLRVVPTDQASEPEVRAQASLAPWFMDYRNADGSVAEMCGNGARVFAHYLRSTGRVADDEFVIATRGGARSVRAHADGQYSVSMGVSAPIDMAGDITVHVDDRSWVAVGVSLPNPHAVVFVEQLAEAGTLSVSPTIAPATAYPHGANVEFVQVLGPHHISMRVFERGVGETLSCGTGACAAAWAARRRMSEAGNTEIRVDVPGGTLLVTENSVGEMTLTGPAVLVASGVLAPDFWQ